MEHYEHPFLSPDFKNEEDSNEVYTPSFEHKTGYQLRDQSPLSFLKQLKDVSAQKTTEPPYLRKRRNKFKQKHDDMSYIAHIMVNNDGQQVLHPLYPANSRGYSMPPIPISNKSSSELMYEEDERINYYPT